MNRIRDIRLTNEYRRFQQLLRSTSLLELVTMNGDPPEDYLLHFKLKGLVRVNGRVQVQEGGFFVEIFLPPDYPRDNPRVLFLRPANIWHPNVAAPVVCWGRYTPGIWLVDLCRQIGDIISYKTFTCNENDALNRDAAAWARGHQEELPVDSRPLVHRDSKVEIVGNE